jgi:hypothetical protein
MTVRRDYAAPGSGRRKGDPVGTSERTMGPWLAGHGRRIEAIKRRSTRRAAQARQRVAYRAVPVSELSPTVRVRSQDRVLLASGVILGVSGAIALRILGRGVRTVLTFSRPGNDSD